MLWGSSISDFVVASLIKPQHELDEIVCVNLWFRGITLIPPTWRSIPTSVQLYHHRWLH
jgi:hypothetical protein